MQKINISINIISNLYENKDMNICVSPLSVYQVMSLVSNGKSGKTQEEILNALVPD